MERDIVGDFEREMWRLYEEPKARLGYTASYFREMLREHGPLETARRLAGESRHHEGLTRLWKCNALDLSVEALVLRDPWNQLFAQDVLDEARAKLRALRYRESGLGLEG